MESNAPLENFKKSIEENVKNTDAEGLLRNLQIFIERYKENIGDEELDDLQTLLSELKRLNKHTATYYEFILFLVVLFILISIFGEIWVLNSLKSAEQFSVARTDFKFIFKYLLR